MFGFDDIILYYNCSQPNTLVLNTSVTWPVYANPGILLLLYYAMATLVKLRRRMDAKVRGCRTEPRHDGGSGDSGDRVCWPSPAAGGGGELCQGAGARSCSPMGALSWLLSLAESRGTGTAVPKGPGGAGELAQGH